MGGITGQLKLVKQAAYLKPETTERALVSMPSFLELVPAGQLNVWLVSVAGVRELSPGPVPPSFSSPGRTQQVIWRPTGDNLSQTISVAPL